MLALLFVVLAAAPTLDKPAGITGEADPCTLGRVIDGDTVDVKVGAAQERLRLLDIDTEESHNSVAKKITPFGLATSDWAKGYIESGGPCWIEYGPERRDVYDRLLAYLWIKKDGAWEDYNLTTIKKGLAPYFTKYGYSKNHHAEFAAAQKKAQDEGLGVWDSGNEGNLRGTYLGPTGLIAWWNERADSLEQFEKEARMRPDILDTRMHWGLIRDHAGQRQTVFTSIRSANEKGSGFIGECEGKLYEPTQIVAANGDSAVENELKATVGKYRYFTGMVTLSDDRKTLRIEIAKLSDISVSPPARPSVAKSAKTPPPAHPKATPAPRKK